MSDWVYSFWILGQVDLTTLLNLTIRNSPGDILLPLGYVVCETVMFSVASVCSQGRGVSPITSWDIICPFIHLQRGDYLRLKEFLVDSTNTCCWLKVRSDRASASLLMMDYIDLHLCHSDQASAAAASLAS